MKWKSAKELETSFLTAILYLIQTGLTSGFDIELFLKCYNASDFYIP